MSNYRGQNLLEMGIIIALVSIVAIIGLSLLGGNIFSMFSQSKDHYSNFEPFGVETSSNPVETTTIDPKTVSMTSPLSNTTIAGVDVKFNEDGSASFNIDGVDISLSSASVRNFDKMFLVEASGSSGAGLTIEVMQAIQRIVENNKEALENGTADLEISFGQSKRKIPLDIDEGEYVEATGIATANFDVNMVQLKVGNSLTLISNDQVIGGKKADKEKSKDAKENSIVIVEGTINGESYNGTELRPLKKYWLINHTPVTIREIAISLMLMVKSWLAMTMMKWNFKCFMSLSKILKN